MLKAKIIQVKTKGNIVLNYKKKPVNPEKPIWEKDSDIGMAAFLLRQPDPAQLEITVHIDEASTGDRYILEGVYNQKTIMFRGVKAVQNQEHELTFIVSAQYEPGMFGRVTSDTLSWRLSHDTSGESVEFKTLNLELYWLYGYDHTFFPRGIPIRILRELAQACWITGQLQPHPSVIPQTLPSHLAVYRSPGIPAKKWVVAAIVNYCFFKNPPRYDFNGLHHFIVIKGFDNISLRLKDYRKEINNPDGVCNCYDQAALLQYFLHVIGIHDVSFCRIEIPFPLKLTYLVGWPGCPHSSSTERSYFMNHALCRLREWDVALDSCIGPHTGNETFFQYLDNVIDPSNYNPGPVFVDRIKHYKGVTNVDWISKQEVNLKDPLIQAFKEKINYEPGKYTNLPRAAVTVNWKTHITDKININHLEVLYENLIQGEGEVLKSWRFKRNGALIYLDIYAFEGTDAESAAEYRFLTLGSLNLNSGITYEIEYPFISPLAAMGKLENGRHIFWKAAANIIIDVKMLDIGDDLLKEMEKWINDFNDFSSVPPMKNLYMASAEPVAAMNAADIKKVAVGEEFEIPLITPVSGTWDFAIKGNGIQLIEEKENALCFKALAVSNNNTIILAAVNPETLSVKNKEITIKVTGPENE